MLWCTRVKCHGLHGLGMVYCVHKGAALDAAQYIIRPRLLVSNQAAMVACR